MGLLLLFDHLYLGVDGFFLLGLLHTAQTSNEGLVGLVKLLCLLFCLLQLHLGNGVHPHQDLLDHPIGEVITILLMNILTRTVNTLSGLSVLIPK